MGLKIDARLERGAGFTALMNGLGTPKLQQAAAGALNEHIRIQEKMLVRAMSAQTRIGAGRVASVTKTRPAGGGAYTEAAVVVRDAAIPLGDETFRTQAAPGAVAGDWRTHMYPHTFMIQRYGGRVYARTTKKRFPIKRIWGPVLPNEALRHNKPAYLGFERFAASDLQQRVVRAVMSALGM